MPLYNPYRNYDKGMDDAYCGREPQQRDQQYMEGYERSLQLEQEEENKKRDQAQTQEPQSQPLQTH